jgi:peptide/nickel transport system substrate-binding protein
MIRQMLRYSLLVVILVVVGCGPTATAVPTEPPPEPTPTEQPQVPAEPTEATASVWTDPVILGTCCEPNSLDPAAWIGAWIQGQVGNAAYEGLTRYDSDGEIEPWLAESWEISDDALTYTFKLRDGVKFHDGSELDAEAVKASFDRMKALQLGVSFLLDPVSQVEVVDRMTVRVTLDQPDINFWFAVPRVMIVSGAAMAANEKDGDWAGDFFREKMVGTGPYQLDLWDPGRQLEMSPFDEYWRGWDGKHISKFVVRFGLDFSSRLLQLEEGNLHIIDWAGLSDARRAAEDPNVVIFTGSGPPMGGHYNFINPNSGPLQDKKVRQALMLAFPYDAFLAVMEGFAEPLKSPATPDMIGYCEVFEPKQDLEKARELLAEAGYSEGFQVTAAYRAANEPRRLAAELYQEALAELGVELVLEDIPWGQFLEAQSQPDTAYDLVVGITQGTPVPSAGVHIFGLGHSSTKGSPNYSRYDNPEFDALFEEGQRLPFGDPKRNELLCDGQRMLIDDAVLMPTMNPQYIELRRVELRGPEYDPYAFMYDMHLYDMYLEE